MLYNSIPFCFSWRLFLNTDKAYIHLIPLSLNNVESMRSFLSLTVCVNLLVFGTSSLSCKFCLIFLLKSYFYPFQARDYFHCRALKLSTVTSQFSAAEIYSFQASDLLPGRKFECWICFVSVTSILKFFYRSGKIVILGEKLVL